MLERAEQDFGTGTSRKPSWRILKLRALIARNLIARASAEIEGFDPLPAIKELANRLDGMAAQQIEQTSYRPASELTDDELGAIASGRVSITVAAENDPPAGQDSGL